MYSTPPETAGFFIALSHLKGFVTKITSQTLTVC